MKKLSLVLCSALLCASSSLATPLDEAIKNVDVSGELRYRYDSTSGNFYGKKGYGIQNEEDRQTHKFFSVLGFDAAIADNFRAFVQLSYDTAEKSFGSDAGVNTTENLKIRQSYFSYANEALASSVLVGKMQIDSIWTDNSSEGLVGTGLKSITALDGLTLAAYVFDNFNNANDSDTLSVPLMVDSKQANPFAENLYGIAALGYAELGDFKLSPEFWFSYLNDSFLFYALNLATQTSFYDDISYKFSLAYLGNSADGELKKDFGVGNGNLFGVSASIEYAGFDASLGGIFYGSKDKTTINTIEDKGNLGDFTPGEEILSSEGSQLYGSLGRNAFGFLTAGYTFNDVLRIGADLVYGGTKIADNIKAEGAGKKFEAVARVGYQYSPKLSFEAFYSYLNIDAKSESAYKNTTRLQAHYQF